MKASYGRVSALCLLLPAVLLSGISAVGQQGKPAPTICPTIKVVCPDSVKSGEKLVFSAQVRGGDPNVTPTFNWTVSAGTIQSGQGTPNIEINTKDLGDSTVTASVEVGGYDRSCSTFISCTSYVMKKPEARKFDEYGRLAPKDEGERLLKYAIELQINPNSQAYIIAYSGKLAKADEAQKAAAKAKADLVKNGLESSKVSLVDGGVRKETTLELWIVPAGAAPPLPTPTKEPEVMRQTKKQS